METLTSPFKVLTISHGMLGACLWYFIPEMWDELELTGLMAQMSTTIFAVPFLPLSLVLAYGAQIESTPLLKIGSLLLFLTQAGSIVAQSTYFTYLQLVYPEGEIKPTVELVLEGLATLFYLIVLCKRVAVLQAGFYVEPAHPHGLVEYRFEGQGTGEKVNMINCSYFA